MGVKSGGRIQGRCHKSPDGSKRFLVGRSLLSYTDEGLAGEFADPLRTTIVQNLSAMTTWVLRKKPALQLVESVDTNSPRVTHQG